MNLTDYLTRRFGNRQGVLNGIKYMITTAFYAPSFRVFWQLWNPLWSYFLTYYLYKPLRQITTQYLAIILTFGASGFLHDCIGMIFLRKFSLPITLFFLHIGIAVVFEQKAIIKFYNISKGFRPAYHTAIMILCATPVYMLYK